MRQNLKVNFQMNFKIIEQNEIDNKPLRKLAEEYNVCKTTIGNIIKNKEEILSACSSNLNPDRKRTFSTSKNENLNRLVYDVVVLCRAENIPISGTLLQAKARSIAQQMGIEGFRASNGWLERFKKRYNVNLGEIRGGYSDDGEPQQKIHKFIADKIEEDQEQKASTMFWSTDEVGEYLDESDMIEEDDVEVVVKTEERLTEFHDIDTALSTMLIGCSLTFEAIDSPHFKNFVAALNPNYTLPTSKTLKERVISKLQLSDY